MSHHDQKTPTLQTRPLRSPNVHNPNWFVQNSRKKSVIFVVEAVGEGGHPIQLREGGAIVHIIQNRSDIRRFREGGARHSNTGGDMVVFCGVNGYGFPLQPQGYHHAFPSNLLNTPLAFDSLSTLGKGRIFTVDADGCAFPSPFLLPTVFGLLRLWVMSSEVCGRLSFLGERVEVNGGQGEGKADGWKWEGVVAGD